MEGRGKGENSGLMVNAPARDPFILEARIETAEFMTGASTTGSMGLESLSFQQSDAHLSDSAQNASDLCSNMLGSCRRFGTVRGG